VLALAVALVALAHRYVALRGADTDLFPRWYALRALLLDNLDPYDPAVTIGAVARTSLAGPGPAILEARQTCDFEGEVSWALGLAARQRFKVTLLANPTRVVVDVKQ